MRKLKSRFCLVRHLTTDKVHLNDPQQTYRTFMSIKVDVLDSVLGVAEGFSERREVGVVMLGRRDHLH